MAPRRPADSITSTTRGPSVQGWILPHLIAWVESQGADSASIRGLLGAADLTDPDVRVPETSVESAWQAAAALTQDDAIGVHLAEFVPRGALDLVEYALRASPSLGVGLERFARYGLVLSDRVAARTETNAHGLLLLIRDTGNTLLHPGRADFALAAALRVARESTGIDITPLQVCLAHPEPPDPSAHRRFFHKPVRFAAGSNSLLLSAVDAARPMQGADDALSSIVRRRLDKVLAERVLRPSGFTGAVRHMMVEQLGKTLLTPDAVAKALAVSRRTLSRRLAGEGRSFRSILDDVRRDFACALLQDPTLSTRDIAFFLQYSEPAAFTRSFRRWTGKTPRAFRKS